MAGWDHRLGEGQRSRRDERQVEEIEIDQE